jgi:hypothetical protein
MIADWRTRFASPDSWFLIVQLPVLGGTPTLNPEVAGAAEVRAVQWDVAHSVANADTAVITGLGDPHDIHPKNKQDVGKRLALIAQARIFGKTVEYSGPVLKTASIEGNAVRVRHDRVGGGLVVRADKLEGFALAGAKILITPGRAKWWASTATSRPRSSKSKPRTAPSGPPIHDRPHPRAHGAIEKPHTIGYTDGYDRSQAQTPMVPIQQVDIAWFAWSCCGGVIRARVVSLFLVPRVPTVADNGL